MDKQRDKQQDKQQDKRRTSRADITLGCELTYNDTCYGCRIRNFSLTGLLIEAHREFGFKSLEPVTLRVPLPGAPDGPSPIHCQVVHCNARYAGVKFTAMDFDTLMALKDLLYRVMADDEKLEAEILRLIRDSARPEEPRPEETGNK